MIQFALKIVYMSLAELYFSPPKWPSTIFLIWQTRTSTSGTENSKRTQHDESSRHNIWNQLRFKFNFLWKH